MIIDSKPIPDIGLMLTRKRIERDQSTPPPATRGRLLRTVMATKLPGGKWRITSVGVKGCV